MTISADELKKQALRHLRDGRESYRLFRVLSAAARALEKSGRKSGRKVKR